MHMRQPRIHQYEKYNNVGWATTQQVDGACNVIYINEYNRGVDKFLLYEIVIKIIYDKMFVKVWHAISYSLRHDHGLEN